MSKSVSVDVSERMKKRMKKRKRVGTTVEEQAQGC